MEKVYQKINLAGSYIDYAEKRLEAANEIIEEFIKAMVN